MASAMAEVALVPGVPFKPLIAGGKSAADVTREVCGALDR